ncbi:MAG: hypothetical protein IK005_03350, partial [Paludibacteraceae bacterium]|nr:hypothetical protein [Paludibacteraceae bacterium]
KRNVIGTGSAQKIKMKAETALSYLFCRFNGNSTTPNFYTKLSFNAFLHEFICNKYRFMHMFDDKSIQK